MNSFDFEKLVEKVPSGRIMDEENYKHFSILISVAYIDSKLQFVFEKRSKKIRQGGEVSFPGGKFDESQDRSLEDTAVRETMEELGIPRSKIHVMKGFDKIASYVYIDSYIGFLDIKSLDELNINKDEVEYAFSLPFDYFIENTPEKHFVKIRAISSEYVGEEFREYLPIDELGLPESYKESWSTGKREILTYQTEHGPLWGLTAKMVVSLLGCMNEVAFSRI